MSESYIETLEKKRQSKTYQVKAPSGFLFTLCRPNLQTYLAGGQIPTGLLERIFEPDPSSATKATAEQQAASVIFMGTLVRQACINPRIVDNPKSKDEIRFEDLDDEDFLFIFNWCKFGGVLGENLVGFPEGRGDASDDSSSGEKRESVGK